MFIIIIIIIFIFMQSICNYMHETRYISKVYIVLAIL